MYMDGFLSSPKEDPQYRKKHQTHIFDQLAVWYQKESLYYQPKQCTTITGILQNDHTYISQRLIPHKQAIHWLVGGWTNPFAKIWVKLEIFRKIRGENQPKKHWNHPLDDPWKINLEHLFFQTFFVFHLPSCLTTSGRAISECLNQMDVWRSQIFFLGGN